MISNLKTGSKTFYILLLLILFFIFLSLLYIRQDNIAQRKQFSTHTAILADDIWAFNQASALSYLQLVLKTGHYKTLSVSIPGNNNIVDITCQGLNGLDQFLHKIKLINERSLSADIVYKGQIIGTLFGIQYIRVIYPLFNMLIFFLLILLTALFILHLFNSKNILELQVNERTKNLTESERRFHDLVNLLPEIVIETDLNGKILYANEIAVSQFYLSNDLETQKSWFDFVAPRERERAQKTFLQTLKGKDSGLSKFTALKADGTTFPVLIRSAPIYIDDEIKGTRSIAIDITERHRLEEQLRRDQKMKAIGLMAGGVAHDLNNILSGIVSYPELLLLKIPNNSDMRQPLEAIHKSGLQAADVVSDLLTVARGVAARTEIISPNELINEYVKSPDFHHLQSQNPLCDFKINLDSQLHAISCSPIHIRKCLMNLVTNGAEAINGFGKLSIQTRNHTLHRSLAKGNEILSKGVYVVIAIHDSGSGISVDDIDHIFEPFYTKKIMGRSGTGLGLTVVWNTMRDHGGAVYVSSDQDGTTFELFFPADYTNPKKVSIKTDWNTYKGNGEKILIIDDEPTQRDIAAELLKQLSYSTYSVSSGEEALNYLKDESVDILVLDMLMRPGMNGLQTYEKILQIHPGQKAIITSGFADDEDVKKTIEMGAGTYIPKPYTLEQLGAAVQKEFARYSPVDRKNQSGDQG